MGKNNSQSVNISSIRFFGVLFLILFSLVFSSFDLKTASAVTGVPKIINFQGRLLNSSGNLLGGPSGTNYCYKFSLYDATTAGTKVWPTGSPSTMTILTREGVFNGSIGDVSAGGDTLDYDFQTNNAIYIDVQVSAIGSGSCTSGDESFESLTPRPQVVSSGFAINSGTVLGFTPAQSATNNQIPVLTSGGLVLGHATAAGIASTGANPFAIDAGASGALNINNTSTGDILLGGGSASTGCTLTNSTGAFVCTAGITGGAGSFTTLTSSGATTLGTGASLTNTFGSGSSSINTIGSTTTPGALTLHGATTLDNTFTVSGSNLTTLGGNLTVTGTAWTATPTISGLITATSGVLSNGNITITKDDASLVFSDANSDTDFWLSATGDEGNDDDDLFQIGDGTTPGTNPFLTIDTSGNVGIGTTPNSTARLHLLNSVGAPTASTYAMFSSAAHQLTTNSSWINTGFLSTAEINQSGFNATDAVGARGVYGIGRASGASGTVTGVAGVYGLAQNSGSSGILTNAYAIYAAANSNNAVLNNNYGLYLAAQTVGSTSNYQIYSAGTANSYFAGNIGIGTDTTPDALLEVENAVVTGGNFLVTNTGVVTSGNVASVVANALTTGVASSISTTSQTTGTGLSITGGGANTLAGGELIDLQMGAATVGNGMNVTTTGAYTGTGLVTLTADALTSGTLLNLNSNGTGGLTNQKGLNIALTGANGTGAQTTYGAYISNNHSGTSPNNVGLYATASGGTNNYAAIFDSGNVGVGTAAPAAKLHSLATTEQLRLGYDVSNYFSTTVSSAGAVTLDAIGSSQGFAFSDTITANSGISIGTQSHTGTTGNIDYTNFDVLGASGNTDIGGTITAGSGNEVITLATGKIDADALTLTAAVDGGTGTSSGSGLIARSDGIGLLQGCADGQVLAWVESSDTWNCTTSSGGVSDGDKGDITVTGSGATWTIDASAVDTSKILNGTIDADDLDQAAADGSPADEECLTFETSGGGDFEWQTCGGGGGGTLQQAYDAGTPTILTDASGDIIFQLIGGATDTQFEINAASAPELDMVNLTNAGFGATASGVDGLSINFVTGDGASVTNSAIDITLTSGGTAVGDTIRGLTFNNITPTAATETGLYFGTGYDNDIQFADLTPTMTLADNGTLVLSDGSSTTNDIFQLGTATSRGNALIYGDLTIKGGNIARSLTGVIDVFVYDTAVDSDGGDWRNSPISLQMSWATEAKDDGAGDACVIASDDRCGTSAFPRKAIIATTASGLYIFDAADNSLWMKFTQTATAALGADSNNNPSGVAAQNGVIVVGTNGASGTGMYAFDFKQDTMYRYNTTNRTQADVNIGNRNNTATYATNAETGFAIIDNLVNDVSINLQTASAENLGGTLLAPIDSQGGPLRGVTLIAAATDTGVSLVNMGYRKVINYSDVTNDDYNQVYVTRRGRMYATNETQSQLEEWKAVDTVLTTQANGTPSRKYDELLAGGTPITLAGAVPTISTSPNALAVIERGSSAKEAAAAGQIDSGDIVFVGTNQGLAEVHTSGGLLPVASWSKITTKDSATPYMPGSNRAAYLFDEAAGATSAASAVGAAGTTRNPMDSANATAPTFGGAGIRGGAVNFNNNSYLCSDANGDGTCDSDTDFNVAQGSFTISLWFKHGTSAAQDTLFERCYTPATPTVAVGCIWGGMTAAGTIKIGLDSITTWTYETTYDDVVTSTATYNDNQWHHLVYTNTDTDICLYIDGRLAAACDIALAATATLDAAQVLTIGGVCSGANCTTGTNFWDGSIDEFVWSSSAANDAANGLTAGSINKLFLDGRTHMVRPSTTVTDATTVSSTTIGDSGESYVVNSFVGLPVELTGGTGSGQTRTIVSNTSTTFTVYPAFSTTPDTTTDYRVAPSRLYGASNTVTAVAVDAPTQINKIRKIYVGTNDGADGGGVSVFSNAGAGGLKTEVYSSDSGVVADDFGTAWSGSNADNIAAISSYSDTLAIASGAFIRAERKDVSMKQLQADTLVALDDIRMNMVASGLFGATQDVLGLGQGADLAEYYYSNEVLEPGDVVAMQPDQPAGVGKSNSRYQKNLLGVVSTAPALTIGPKAENSYAVALAGRIPVKITDENGSVHVGDELTASSRPGYAMKAKLAGSIIGRVINEPEPMISCSAPPLLMAEAVGDGPGVTVESTSVIPEPPPKTKKEDVPETNLVPSSENPTEEDDSKCGYAMLFIGLSDSLGQDVEKLAEEYRAAQKAGLASETIALDENPKEEEGGLTWEGKEKETLILDFLRSVRSSYTRDTILQSIFTDRLASAVDIITPVLYADELLISGVAEFKVPPLFNTDTAGFAIIKKGSTSVRVDFDNPYIAQPVVSAGISYEEDDDVEDDDLEELFARSIVKDKSEKGFTILIDKVAPRDIRFSWIALAVKDAKVFESLIPGLVIEPAYEKVPEAKEESEEIPEAITEDPAPIIEPDPVPDLPEDPELSTEEIPEEAPDTVIDPDPISESPTDPESSASEAPDTVVEEGEPPAL